MWWTFLYALGAIIAGVYYVAQRKFDYWKKQNVPYIKPTPILGNYGDVILQKKSWLKLVEDLGKNLPDEPYFGAFFGTEPTLIVKDPELIKLVTTKDFYYFSGRETSNYVHKEVFTQNLFLNGGDQWKVVRQNLTPVFTTAKMKNMFHLIAECSYDFEKLLDEEIIHCDNFEARAQMARYTMACITSCAFGVEAGTMEKGFEKNPFTSVGNAFMSPSRILFAKNTIKSIWPAIFYGLGFKVVPHGAEDFFKKLVFQVFEARQYKPTARNDFVDFLLSFKQNGDYIIGDAMTNLKTGASEKVKLELTEDLLLSQCIVFFLGGFETSSSAAAYTLFELAKNPEIQNKVHEEMNAYLKKYDNKLTYDIVNELPYTYACVEEALRLYPVLVNLTREVVDDYTLPTGVLLKKGVRVHIPVYHLHKNPKYFPDPDVYRPERFLGDERRNIVPYSYLPFGEGSRICIGMRFAKMQVLAGLLTLLKKYEVELEQGTPLQLEFEECVAVPQPKHPITVKVTPREGWENRTFNKA